MKPQRTTNLQTASGYDPTDPRNRNQQTSAEFEMELAWKNYKQNEFLTPSEARIERQAFVSGWNAASNLNTQATNTASH